MTKAGLIATLALSSISVIASAQAPQGGAQQPPATQPKAQTPATQAPPTAAAQKAATTLTGCLYREDQVPGRKPNIAEKAGVLEDYILADATASSAQPPTAGAPQATGTSGTRGSMYKVEGPSDEQLKALVGKRVQVTGRIDPERSPSGPTTTPQPDRGPGPDDINLPEVEASSIREVAGTCPATPAAPK
jgi:hypothetical protein